MVLAAPTGCRMPRQTSPPEPRNERTNTMPRTTTIGQTLKRLRLQANVSQDRLASAAGVHLTLVRFAEGDKVAPSFLHVQAFARALGVSLSAFDESVVCEQPPRRRKAPA